MERRLHPKIEKNLYDLNHERYLQKSHTIANLGMGSILAFWGGVATYIIEGEHEITKNLVLFILFGSCLIFVLFYSYYLISRNKRYEIVEKIKELNSYTKEL